MPRRIVEKRDSTFLDLGGVNEEKNTAPNLPRKGNKSCIVDD
jgi:hypothetical protein